MCKASESEHSEIIKRVDKWKVEPNDRNQWKLKLASWNWQAPSDRGGDDDTVVQRARWHCIKELPEFPCWVSIKWSMWHAGITTLKEKFDCFKKTLILRSKRLGLKSSRRIFNTISQMAPALAMVPFLLFLWYFFCSRYGTSTCSYPRSRQRQNYPH